MTVYCENCKKPKQVVDSDKNKNKRHFCDVSCRTQWQSLNGQQYRKSQKSELEVYCARCDTPKQVADTEYNRTKNNWHDC